jgi:hypothetical protein
VTDHAPTPAGVPARRERALQGEVSSVESGKVYHVEDDEINDELDEMAHVVRGAARNSGQAHGFTSISRGHLPHGFTITLKVGDK